MLKSCVIVFSIGDWLREFPECPEGDEKEVLDLGKRGRSVEVSGHGSNLRTDRCLLGRDLPTVTRRSDKSWGPGGRASCRLLDSIRLLEIVAGAEKLNVLGSQGRSTFGVGDYVVEMEVVRGATPCALPSVAFPHLKFHVGRDETRSIKCSDRSIAPLFSHSETSSQTRAYRATTGLTMVEVPNLALPISPNDCS